MTQTDSRGLPASRKEARALWLRDAVMKQGPLHVRDAAESLDVSEMTVRRDVRENPEMLQFLGGHIVLSQDAVRRAPYDLSDAAEVNQDAKRAACEACLPLLEPEATIFVDCGTTLPHLIHAIPSDMKLTVICYALNIADLVVRKPDVKLVLLGGVYHPATASFYPVEEDGTLDAYAVNLAFMSAAGVDAALGVTCTTFREAGLKRLAMRRAARSVLVTDRSKFGTVRSARFAGLEDFSDVATEDGLIPPSGLSPDGLRRDRT
ncbi:DeoR family transcriptional regulator [Sagittula sp. P11]|uniref:DeoR/GlpR family DNA-binding transcription regulator n=1 Tax=Sagittula sp. P11 TaxID=2009329 RepID=UPI000C2D23A4|nr:DeoR/GlpR family DNA-binding transcription regulator [Sagittula sp. P11]AUC55465.1 DeoR family transcriptional regulator [Sagittula sp. P11]